MTNLRIRPDSSPAPLRIVDNRVAASSRAPARAIAIAQADAYSPARNFAAKVTVSLLGATATVGSAVVAAGTTASSGHPIAAVLTAVAIAIAGLAYTEHAVAWQDRKNG